MSDESRPGKQDAEEQSMFDFFSETGVGTFEYEPPKKGGIWSVRRGIQSVVGMIAVVAAMSAMLIIAIFAGLSYLSSVTEPAVSWYKSLPEELPEAAIAERNTMYDSNGDRIANFWVQDRQITEDLDDISDYAIEGLIAVEDQRFWEHSGFDPIGTARAALTQSGGGSGITQQLVKNLQFYDQTSSEEERLGAIDVSVERKIQELRYSIAYERENSKEEILLEYFNVVSFGGPDVYSIESAAQFFFGKSAADLELHEASVLVGSVQNTSRFNLQDPEMEPHYKKRQAAVLDRMYAEGVITQEEASEAYERDLEIEENERAGGCSRSDYPFFCDYAIDYLRDDPSLGEDAETRNGVLAAGGLQIHTTLDPEMLELINERVKSGLGNDNRVTLPVTVVEPGTGEVLAFGFNRDYGNGDNDTSTEINLADAGTGTGSTFKMFTLAAAANGQLNESQMAFNAPCPWNRDGYDVPEGGIRNSTGCSGFQTGYMDHLTGTAVSSNTYFTELQHRVGIEAVSEFAESVGLHGMRDENGDVYTRAASYTLGPVEESPIDVAAAYATFAAEGVYCPPTPITTIEYSDGSQPRIPDNYDPAEQTCRGVMSPAASSMVLNAMRANMTDEVHPEALGQDAAIDGYDAVGKSGTNQLTNQAFGMVSAQYAMYGNAYDFARPANEIDGYYHHGEVRAWDDSAPQRVVSDIMEESLNGQDNIPLDYNSSDWSIEEIPVDTRDYVTVPSAIGMEPEASLSVFEGTGLTVEIDRSRCEPEEEPANSYPTGVVVGQSVEPGEQLPRGTETEIVLCTNS